MLVIKDKEFPSGVLYAIDTNSRTAYLRLSNEDYFKLREMAPNASLLDMDWFTLKFGNDFNQSMVEFTEDGGPNHLKIIF